MTNKELKEFYRFLKENGLYTAWMYNILHTEPTPDYRENGGNYSSYINNIQELDVLLCSFRWCSSQQGHNFWEDIHNKWTNFCYNKGRNYD